IDTLAKIQPKSRFISQKEYHSIYPDKIPRRLNFVFRKYTTRCNVDKKIAFFLIKKYPSIKIVNDKLEILNVSDNLDELSLLELRKLSAQYPFNSLGMGKEDMKFNIRKCKKNKINPIKKEKKEQQNEGLLIINTLPYNELFKKARSLGYKGKWAKTEILEKYIEEHK
ncbi:MAG: hypothetical protein H8D22_12895, partial [Candidatus Cloacimonetes bacterium]|nr:hypothetical protein [Candidatus Cloacimonadota bacterium]